MFLNKKLGFILALFAITITLISCSNKDVEAPTPTPPSNNKTPIASAGADQVITLPVKMVKLNGSDSKDADGKITKYEWTKIDGPTTFKIETPTKDTTTVSGLIEGTYSFKLTVTDDKNASSSDTVKVIVNKDGSKPPVANAGQNQTITLPTSMVTLDGSLSRDQAGSTDLAYKWEYVSGPNTPAIGTSDKVTTQVTGLIEGVYTFQLTVTQNGGLMNIATVQVTVNKAGTNQPPVARAVATPDNITLPTSSVTLDGSQSSDADGDAITYKWTKITAPTGDASSITNDVQNKTTVTGLIAGNYTFQLMVDDGKGAKNSATVNVTVIAPMPVASTAGTVTNITLDDGTPLEALTLDGSASKDYDGNTISKFNWEKISGSTATITDPTASKTTVTGLTPGIYTFKLTVTTNDGRKNNTIVNVEVTTINGLWTGSTTVLGYTYMLQLNLKSKSVDDNILIFDDNSIPSHSNVNGTYKVVSAMDGKVTITGKFGASDDYTFSGEFIDKNAQLNITLRYPDPAAAGKFKNISFMLVNMSI